MLIIEDKDKTVCGVSDVLATEEKLVNLISDTISPRLIPSIEIISWRNKQIIAIEVFPSPIRPHFKTTLGEEKGVFVRVGSSNRKADVTLVRELHRMVRRQSYDEEPFLEENSEALDFRAVSELFDGVSRIKKQNLLTLRLLTTYQNKQIPTNGGIILFGKERLKYFSDAWVQCGRFDGVNKKKITDTLELKTYPIHAIDQAIEFTKKHALRAIEISVKANHHERWNVPLLAVREAIINAVVHADYSQTGAHIRLSFFDDRIEIDNPGLLYDGLTIDDIKQGVSKLRNRVIGRIFKELRLIEQWGSGVQRMIADCQEMGLPSPEFVELGGQFRVIFCLIGKPKMTFDDTNAAIIDFLSTAEGLSVKDIAAEIGLSTRTIRSRLSKLKARGVVTVVGTGPRDPRRKYFLLKKPEP